MRCFKIKVIVEIARCVSIEGICQQLNGITGDSLYREVRRLNYCSIADDHTYRFICGVTKAYHLVIFVSS